MTDPVQPLVNCQLVNNYDWNKQIAYAICMAESQDNPNATDNDSDGSTDYGLMQINSIHADLVNGDLNSLFDPATNIKIAYKLSQQGTKWTAWTTYNNGEYKKWL